MRYLLSHIFLPLLVSFSAYAQTLSGITPPQMVLIEGGTFSFKSEGQPAVIQKIKPFYISIYEETNAQYGAYLKFLLKCKLKDKYINALPDTSVWLNENFTKEEQNFFSKNYLRNAQFADFPVVGLDTLQIREYSEWKSDRLNELILIREGILDYYEIDSAAIAKNDYFKSNEYLAGKWVGELPPSPPPKPEKGMVRMEDGLFLPLYRLPEESEWKLAALAIGDSAHTYIITPKSEKQKKFDKGRHYNYLFIKAEKKKESPLQQKLISKGLKRVYDGKMNNYDICNLYSNVSELLKTGNSIGGGTYIDYAAVYDPAIKSGIKYKFPQDFKMNNKSASSLSGFRLVMPYYDYPDGKLPGKRKRGK